MKGKLVLVGTMLAAALTAGGLALGAGQATKTTLKATLNVGQEVPKPTGVRRGATGLFTATLSRQSDGSGMLTWKLTFRRLTGAATAAHIHLGRPGKSGPVAIPLCGPCSSGVTGTSPASANVVRTLLRNGAYANVHTLRNPSGEIRGQITKAVAGS
jgi:CHRD domain-containing protein